MQFFNTLGPQGTGVRIRRRRLALGLTQNELGHKAGISGAMISYLERGLGRHPHSRHLIEIAVALDCSAEWLAGLMGPAPKLVAAEAPGVMEDGRRAHRTLRAAAARRLAREWKALARDWKAKVAVPRQVRG